MSHASKLDKFLMSYKNATAWGNADHSEAVHEAINVAYPELSDADKANLYSEVIQGFEQYDKTRLVSRRLWLGTLLNSWAMARRGQYLQDIRKANMQVEVNVQQEAVLSGVSMEKARAVVAHVREDVPVSDLTLDGYMDAQAAAAKLVQDKANG